MGSPILGETSLGPCEAQGKRLMKLTRETIIQHFGDLWPVHNRGFTTLLIECRALCDSDLDQALILSVIGTRTLLNRGTEGMSYTDFVTGRRTTGISRHINLQSIAAGTGIPRETVRRKINRLIDRGWVERTEAGTFEVTDKAVTELAPATHATFDYLLAVGEAMLALAAEKQEPSAGKAGAEKKK